MYILGSRRSFTEKKSPKARECGECHQRYPAGHIWLVSIRKGKVMKRVCSEACRLEFDDRFWQDVADQRDMRR